MATDTTNYLLKKPTVGGDDDLWGGYINDNMDTIDTQMKSNDDAAAAAQSTADTATTTANAALPKAGGTMTGDTAHGDNVKATFGASDDLQIYHDGVNSYIDNSVGNLYIRDTDYSGDIYIQPKPNENAIICYNDSSVVLNYDNATKLATTSTGVDVTGTVTADGLTVQGNAAIGLNQDISMSAGADGQLQIDGNGYNAAIALDTVGMNIYTNSATRGIIFGTNETERARIDSSGNLLVGGTTAAEAGSLTVYPTGIVQARVNNNNAAIFDRIGSDGEILDIRKDGTTVGSIGTTGGEITLGSGDTGLRFTAAADRIDPWNMSTNGARDAAIDLGVGSRRFKDAYLSGGVYLGGTGAANKLDDYETGTWTPVWKVGTTSQSITGLLARYKKIGDLVTVTFRGYVSSPSGTGSVTIEGLPFAPASFSSLNYQNFPWVGYKISRSNGVPYMQLEPASTTLKAVISLDNGLSSHVTDTELGDTPQIRFTIQYHTS